MKILIIGDSHGNIANLKHVMGFVKTIDAKAVIHTGDWDRKAVQDKFQNSEVLIYTVLGNADIDILEDESLKKDFKNSVKFSKGRFILDGKKIGLIHSFNASETWYRDCDIVFCGHRHSQDERIVNGVKIVRPGALENGINFAVYDTKTKMVEFIHE